MTKLYLKTLGLYLLNVKDEGSCEKQQRTRLKAQ